MSQWAHVSPRRVELSSLSVAFEELSSDETLHVDGFGLSIGSESVGLPTACTADAVLLRYLDLVRLIGHGRGSGTNGAQRDDVDVLAAATSLDRTTVRRRLEHLHR